MLVGGDFFSRNSPKDFMGVFGILYGSFWDFFWDVLGFYELLMGVSSNDGTFDPSTGPFWTVQTLNLRSFAIPSHLESLESLYLELQFQCSLSGYMYKYIYIYPLTTIVTGLTFLFMDVY